MKKLLLLAVGVAAGLSASATTIYFDNERNWDPVMVWQWDGPDATNEGVSWPGTTKATETAVKDGKTYIKWETQCNSVIFTNSTGSAQSKAIVPQQDMIYNMDGPTGESFQGGSLEIAHDVYVTGTFCGWTVQPEYKFTSVGDGNYEFTLNTLDSDFKIVADGEWLGYTESALQSGQSYVLYDSGMENCNLAQVPANNVVFNFNLNTKTLVVTYDKGALVVPDQLYVFGTLVSGEWAPQDAVELTKNGNIFTIDNLKVKTAFGLESALVRFTTVRSTDWDNDVNPNCYGASTDGETVTFGTPMDLYKAANNFSIIPTTANEDGEFIINIGIDFENGTVTFVEVESETPDPNWPDLYVLGDFNGFTARNAYTRTRTNTGYTYDFKDGINPDDPNGSFIIWSEDAEWAFGAKESGQEVKLGETVDAWFNGDYWFNVFVISTNEPTKVTLNVVEGSAVEDAVVPAKLSFQSTTGVAELDADNTEAVYFNLQGVRVANPENGLFIKVQGNKTSKVAL